MRLKEGLRLKEKERKMKPRGWLKLKEDDKKN